MLATHFVNPYVIKLVSSIPLLVLKYTASILGVLFATDLLTTIANLVHFNTYLAKLKEFGNSIKDRFETEDWFNEYDNISDMFAVVKERAKERKSNISSKLIERIDTFSTKHNSMERFIHKFPTMKSRMYGQQIKHIKYQIKKRINKEEK